MNPPTREDILKEIAENDIILGKVVNDNLVALEKGREIESEARGMIENLRDQARLQQRDPSQPIDHSSLELANEM